LLTALNAARHAHPALQRLGGLRFHSIDNDQLIAYTKQTDDRTDLVLVVVSLDPHREQSGTLELDLDALALEGGRPLELHDALTDETRLWHGSRQALTFTPGTRQAVVFGVRQSGRTEQQFETYR
jgi:starch synthase (maltosyl-transferring)